MGFTMARSQANLVIDASFHGSWCSWGKPWCRCNIIKLSSIKNSRNNSPIFRFFLIRQINDLNEGWQQSPKLVLLHKEAVFNLIVDFWCPCMLQSESFHIVDIHTLSGSLRLLYMFLNFLSNSEHTITISFWDHLCGLQISGSTC